MKRAVFLVLVVGMVSTAGGQTVSLTSPDPTNVAGTITVNLTLDFASTGIYQIDFISSGSVVINDVGTWKTPMNTWSGGPCNGTLQGGDIVGAYAETLNGATEVDADAVLYSFEVTVNGSGELTPYMSSTDYAFTLNPPDYGYTGDELTMSGMTVSPEPMTVALLSIGGLLLRLRRR